MSVTVGLILVIGLISFWAFQSTSIKGRFIMHPYTVHHHNQYYRFLSSGFIHADFMHLAFNCYAMYLFGQYAEAFFMNAFGETQGMINFFLLFVLGVIVSSVPTFFKHKDNPSYFALGASGGVSSVMFAAIMFYPLLPLQFILIPIPIPGFILGILYLIYSHYADKKQQDNIGHSAHLYGAIFGIVFTCVMYPSVMVSFYEQIVNRYFG
ncbi:MAG: rhomboid family intramembrane serine protease [Cytophagales bacterium]|nr:rhomboid family intramembrane serine protease [Cytophagales bacterium]